MMKVWWDDVKLDVTPGWIPRIIENHSDDFTGWHGFKTKNLILLLVNDSLKNLWSSNLGTHAVNIVNKVYCSGDRIPPSPLLLHSQSLQKTNPLGMFHRRSRQLIQQRCWTLFYKNDTKNLSTFTTESRENDILKNISQKRTIQTRHSYFPWRQ